MKLYDLENEATISQIIDPAVTTADATSTAVDLAGFRGCTILTAVGQSGDTLSGSVYIELELQESDDNSTYTAVADADITNAVSGSTNTGTYALIDDAAEDDAVYPCTYLGSKRYLKTVVNVTGTHTNGTPIGSLAIKHGENYQP